MTAEEYKLHEIMIRHATGMIATYKTWLGKQVIEDPDPVEHFTEKAEAIAKRDAELHRAE